MADTAVRPSEAIESNATHTAASAPSPIAGERLVSLDVFRGVTIASMLLVNNPGSGDIYAQLEHASWNGWTFTDTVFPFFLWISGVAMTLSFARRVERGESRRTLFLHSLRRAAILFALGLFLNGFPYYHLSTWRIPGVLQRIAVCYLIAAAIFLTTKLRGQIAITALCLGGYWLLMMLVPVPGLGAGHLERNANLANYVDRLFLEGHMYAATRTYDPEGFISTIPAIATILFGVLTGHILRLRREPAEKAVWMFLSGNCLIFVGLAMNYWLPINKNLWTSSFAVYMAGLASSAFAVYYWLVDGKGWRRWSRPFAIYGMNAIAVYTLAGLLARMLGLIAIGGVSLHRIIFQNVFLPMASPINASLLYAITDVLLLYAAAYAMYRRAWFVRF